MTERPNPRADKPSKKQPPSLAPSEQSVASPFVAAQKKLLDALKDTSLWAEGFFYVEPASRPGMSPQEAYALMHAKAEDGPGAAPPGPAAQKDDGHVWGYTLHTSSRLDYLEALPKIAKALDGMPVELKENTSWHWDDQARTKAGRRRHLTVYLLHVGIDREKTFAANRWLEGAAKHVIRGQDPRADLYPPQMLEDQDLPPEWLLGWETVAGKLVLECLNRRAAQQLASSLFADCKCTVSTAKTSTATLVVELPC
jgi:hypothetical protein